MKQTVLTRLMRYTVPYFKTFATAVFFMVVASALNTLPPWLFKSVVNDVLISRNMKVLNVLCVGVVVIFVFKGLALYGQQYFMNWVGQRVVMDIRIALYDHMQRMSLRYIHASRVGELMSIETYPHPTRIAAFYGQSVSLTAFLALRDDPAKFVEFLRRGMDYGYYRALREVYAIDGVAHLERLWHAERTASRTGFSRSRSPTTVVTVSSGNRPTGGVRLVRPFNAVKNALSPKN